MKILVKLPNWLGDVVMSLGFLNMLPRVFPDPEIHIIIKEKLSHLMSLCPEVSCIYKYDKKPGGSLFEFYSFTKSIKRSHAYDIYFSLPNSFSAALMGFFTGSKVRIGYKNELRSFLLTKSYTRPLNIHRVEEYLNLLLLSGYIDTKPDTITVKLDPFLSEDAADKFPFLKKGYIVLNVNSVAPSRRLPVKKATAIADALIGKFNIPVVLIGAQDEMDHTDNIVKGIQKPENVINICGKTSLEELMQVLNAGTAVVSTDSGIAHLANALECKCVVLFGAGREENTAPYNKKNCYIVRAENIVCAPCILNECKFEVTKCLEDIKTDEIVSIVEKLIRDK